MAYEVIGWQFQRLIAGPEEGVNDLASLCVVSCVLQLLSWNHLPSYTGPFELHSKGNPKVVASLLLVSPACRHAYISIPDIAYPIR